MDDISSDEERLEKSDNGADTVFASESDSSDCHTLVLHYDLTTFVITVFFLIFTNFKTIQSKTSK